METINPSNLRGDEYLKGYSEAGMARISLLDVTRPAPIIKAVAGAAYTLVSGDHGKILAVAAECSITVPATLRAGFMCGISQESADAVTVVAGDGVTVTPDGAGLATEARYVIVTLIQWGDLVTYRLIGRTA